MFQDWLRLFKVLKESPAEKRGLTCPECGSASVDFQFVGDKSSRVGYLNIWCCSCNQGVYLSRVAIPESAEMISFEAPNEVIEKRIPNFRLVEPLELE
jgi:transcription elongation factor Elf1